MTIRFPQRNLSPASNAWADSIERQLQTNTQIVKEVQQSVDRAISGVNSAFDSVISHKNDLEQTELRLSEISTQQQENGATAGSALETAQTTIMWREAAPTEDDIPFAEDSIWYVGDPKTGTIDEVWQWVPPIFSDEEPELIREGQWVQKQFGTDAITDEITETIVELNDFNKDVIDPFIRDTDQKLLENEQAAQDAQAKALEALTTGNRAEEKADAAAQSVTVEYAVGSSETVAPVSGWSASQPTRAPGSFIWYRAVITYGSGDTSTSAPALMTGNTGSDGAPGKDGVGLTGTTVTYAKSTSATTAPTSGWGTSVPTATPGQYLWTRTVWAYSDSTSETGYSVGMWGAQGASGSDGLPGAPGVGIDDTIITYAQSTSGTTPPSSGWQGTPPAPVAGRYVWTRTVWHYTDSSVETGYSVGKIGDTGAKGDKGEQGVSVTAVTSYWQTTTGSKPAKPTTVTPPAAWVATEPGYEDNRTLWRVDKVTFSNGTWSYSDVSEVSSYRAASQAIQIANLAQQQAEGAVWVGPAEPPAAARVPGQVWLETDGEDRMVGMWVLRDASAATPVWDQYAMLTGLLIVPGNNGTPTIIDQTGMTVGTIMADSITGNVLAADSVGAKQLVIGEISREHLDGDVDGVLAEAEEWANRVVILPDSITISKGIVGSQQSLTALRLEATRISLIVDNKPIAYLDSERDLMSIGNATIRDSLQVGEHQVRRIGQNNITVFQWVGV